MYNLFQIQGYEGRYYASPDGKIYSSLSNKYLKAKIDKDGYEKVNLYKNEKQKTFFVHRLIANTFLTNFNNKPQINHKNFNKIDNHIDNLEWVTDVENKCHYLNHRNKITNQEIDKHIKHQQIKKEENIRVYCFPY